MIIQGKGHGSMSMTTARWPGSAKAPMGAWIHSKMDHGAIAGGALGSMDHTRWATARSQRRPRLWITAKMGMSAIAGTDGGSRITSRDHGSAEAPENHQRTPHSRFLTDAMRQRLSRINLPTSSPTAPIKQFFLLDQPSKYQDADEGTAPWPGCVGWVAVLQPGLIPLEASYQRVTRIAELQLCTALIGPWWMGSSRRSPGLQTGVADNWAAFGIQGNGASHAFEGRSTAFSARMANSARLEGEVRHLLTNRADSPATAE